MLSLSSELDTLCFTLFMKCDEFDSIAELRAVFSTNDLYPFRDNLPVRSGSKKAFVSEVKLFLLEKELSDGRELMLPFLSTLRGRYPEEDALHASVGLLQQRL